MTETPQIIHKLAMQPYYGELNRGVDAETLDDIGLRDPEAAVEQWHDAVELSGRLTVGTTAEASREAARTADHEANNIKYGLSGQPKFTPEEAAARKQRFDELKSSYRKPKE